MENFEGEISSKSMFIITFQEEGSVPSAIISHSLFLAENSRYFLLWKEKFAQVVQHTCVLGYDVNAYGGFTHVQREP